MEMMRMNLQQPHSTSNNACQPPTNLNKLHHMQRIIRGSTSLLRSGRIHQKEGGAGAGAGTGARLPSSSTLSKLALCDGNGWSLPLATLYQLALWDGHDMRMMLRKNSCWSWRSRSSMMMMRRRRSSSRAGWGVRILMDGALSPAEYDDAKE